MDQVEMTPATTKKADTPTPINRNFIMCFNIDLDCKGDQNWMNILCYNPDRKTQSEFDGKMRKM